MLVDTQWGVLGMYLNFCPCPQGWSQSQFLAEAKPQNYLANSHLAVPNLLALVTNTPNISLVSLAITKM